MRITSVNIPESQLTNGLKEIKMEKLGPVVLLAGKNGAGKSRLINELQAQFSLCPTIAQRQSLQRHIQGETERLENLLEFRRLSIGAPTLEVSARQIEKQEQQLWGIEQEIVTVGATIKSTTAALHKRHTIETDVLGEQYQSVRLVPKSVDLFTTEQDSWHHIQVKAAQVDELGVDKLANATLAKIEATQNRWFEATHQYSTITELEKALAVEEYEKLQQLIEIFFGDRLKRNVNARPTLFGRPLETVALSDGQKILLQFVMIIYRQATALDDLVIFMDEPENHLHPSVIIDVIERLRSHAKNGQIWIATHSLPLLAHFDPAYLWFVNEGAVSYAGREPEKVLNSLLGGAEGVQKLRDFTSLPAEFALSRHAFECLFQSPAVNTGSHDPQTAQIRESIQRHLANADRMRILDFGAGKGRLLANIIEHRNDFKHPLKDLLDYVAYDEYPADRKHCEGLLSTIYDDVQRRYATCMKDLLSHHDRDSFDVVVMANVLHEIDPKDWLKRFGPKGDVTQMLAPGGVLLMLEDQEMYTGEKAYEKGFLVLDTPELKELFSIKAGESGFSFQELQGGKLKAHSIPREMLTRITPASRAAALEMLQQRALREIQNIRGGEANYRAGKRHGFWIQQLANSTLALEELKGA